MARPRTCPHCTRTIPLRKGYEFDEHNNMICACGRIVFPASAEAEEQLNNKKRKGPTTTSTYWSHHRQWHGQGGYAGGASNGPGKSIGVGL